MEDEDFLDHPCRYLRKMTQLQCERFLLYLAAVSGMEPESALRFAVVFKNAIFYPNDGLAMTTDRELLILRSSCPGQSGNTERMSRQEML